MGFEVVLVAWIGACKKAPPTPSFASSVALSTEEDVEAHAPAASVGPGRWAGAGWSLVVPPGWSGSSGPGSRLLTLEREGIHFALVRDPAPERPADDCFFEGYGAMAVPALGLARTWSCTAEGRLVWSWWADGLAVVVDVPLGRAVEGRLAVEPLLEGLVRR